MICCRQAPSTEVTMTWNTGYQADHYQQTATLTTNDPLAKSITLTVSGEVRAEFITPDSVDFKTSDRAELTESSFVVFSQLWKSFTVENIECDLDGFEWNAEPVASHVPELVDREARSAWRIRVFAFSESYGEFKGNITLTVRPDTGAADVVRSLACAGKVRAPIGFYSPDIHKTEGLDIGTVVSDKEHEFHLVVRSRSDHDRKIEVLDVKPEELSASLTPLSQPGSYRLTLTVPAGCPMVVFNADQQHGYVQVGDADDKSFSNWFPLYGAVATVK